MSAFNQQMIYDPGPPAELFLPPEVLTEETSRLTRLPSHEPEATSRRHRGPRHRVKWASPSARSRWLRAVSLLIAACAAALVAMLSVLSGLMSYQPLRDAASPGLSSQLTAWWPLLTYGPWLVASLSILRAALHQRRAAHSWAVVVTFSCLAVALCVLQAPPTPIGMAVAGLPPLSALVAFHQIIRQMTLNNPPRHAAVPRQRAGLHRG